MCKFCVDDFEIETSIGGDDIIIKLDPEYKDTLKIIMPYGHGNSTSPIKIKYCPFCGDKLFKEKCAACNGSGWYDRCDEDGNSIKCSSCNGTGEE